MSIIIITIIIFLCTVNGKGEWSLHDLEVGEVQNLHKISNVGDCQLREKLARGGNWAMFRFKAVGTIQGGGYAAASSSSWSMINDHCYYNTFRCLAIEAEAFKDYILLPVIIIPFIPSTLPSWMYGLCNSKLSKNFHFQKTLATIVGRIRWDLGRMFFKRCSQ